MKKTIVSISMLLIALMVRGFAGTPAPTASASAQFDQLRGMLGKWEADKGPHGTVRAWNRMVSAGSVLMETFRSADEPEMDSMYHLDKNELIMTHYCSAGNQPRMRADISSKDPKTLKFSLVDVSNLKDPLDGHMVRLAITFLDKDHFSEDWTWLEKGKETTYSFHFKRATEADQK